MLTTSKKHKRVRLHLEPLEDRLAPAAGALASFAVVPEIPVLDRLDRFVPSAIPSLSNWQPVVAADSHLDPSDNGGDSNIYVIAHGWAPGFKTMVTHNSTATDPLKWWQTLDTSLADSPGFPASQEMFYASAGDGIQISPTGLAYAITQADPKAVVLAYSWIDESATDQLANTFPEDPWLSEAYTAMNGQRLANALEMALPTSFHTDGGNLHLIGHSHGSKVATVATLVLDNTNNANFHVAQLTVLDSPENSSTLVSASDSANNLWFFLGGLNISHTSPSASQTFVDHYISEFDNPDGSIQGVDPFNTSQQESSLQQIVDVNLKGRVLYNATAFADLHAYAFNWYAGGSLAWAQNPTPTVADQWSPLVNAANLPTAGSYTQTWTGPTQKQFQLMAGPTNNVVKQHPVFTDLGFGNVNLSETGSSTASFSGFVVPTLSHGMDGISFQYKFNNVGQGDQLVISMFSADGYQIGYVMTGTVAGMATGVGTISFPTRVPRYLKIQLIPPAGGKSSGASVTISNLQQFVLVSNSLRDTSPIRLSQVSGFSTGQVVVANFTYSDPSAQLSNFHAVINWGDNTSSLGTVVLVSRTAASSNWKVVGSHTYTKRPTFWTPFIVTVTISDLAGHTLNSQKTWFF
ncbi:MAG TPA: hypothetical protein VKE98_07130 [Gemmataceae bacterium]|nr:hypothetical protein [Gemmataceae bacterium]